MNQIPSFVGEIKLLPISFNPKGWLKCKGQSLIIGKNSALFSVIGNRFGGNGINNFCVPNMEFNLVGMDYFICIDQNAIIPER